jgi:hypothetical protein
MGIKCKYDWEVLSELFSFRIKKIAARRAKPIGRIVPMNNLVLPCIDKKIPKMSITMILIIFIGLFDGSHEIRINGNIHALIFDNRDIIIPNPNSDPNIRFDGLLYHFKLK